MKTTTTIENGTGYFEVEFTDGLAGISFHECSLDNIIHMLANMIPAREVKSISWIVEE